MRRLLYFIYHWLLLLLPSFTKLQNTSEPDRRVLKKLGTFYDVVVVSMGGTGCTSMLAKIGKSKGRHAKPIMNNIFNEDKAKHSFPSRWNGVNLRYGAIYVTGNLTLAIKSLVRRHFIYYQTILLQGDSKWIQLQRYPSFTRKANNTSNEDLLFRKAPKWEKSEDEVFIRSNISLLHPSVLRMQRILEKAGRDQRDPIGLWNHFVSWSKAAKSGYFRFPILFLSMGHMNKVDSGKNRSSGSNSSRSDSTGITALKKFVNISVASKVDFSYHSSSRKGGDIIEAAVRFAESDEQRSWIRAGIDLYDALSRQASQYHTKVFLPRKV